MRLILCSSPTHVVRAHACLQQAGDDIGRPTGFMILGAQRPELCRAIRRTVDLLFPGMPVREAPELPKAADFDSWTPEQLVSLGRQAVAAIGAGAITELWVYSLYAASQKLLIELLSEARVFFVDDGLDSYNQQPVHDPDAGEGHEAILAAIRPKGVMRQHLRRLAGIFLGLVREMRLPAYLSGLAYLEMEAEQQRRSLEAMGPHPLWDVRPPETGRGWAIVIGSSFYRLGLLSAQDEESLYLDTCRLLAAQGYRVLYKPHPRAAMAIPPLDRDAPFIPPEDAEMPLEWILLHCPVDLIVSICSTSLLTLQDMKGCRSLVLSRATPLFRHTPPEHVGHLRGILPHLPVPPPSTPAAEAGPTSYPWFKPQQNIQIDEVRVLYYWQRGCPYGTFLDVGGGGLASLIPFLHGGWRVLAVPMQAAIAGALDTALAGHPGAIIDSSLVGAPRITPDAIATLVHRQKMTDVTLLKIGGIDLEDTYPCGAFQPEAVLCGFDDDLPGRTLAKTAGLLGRYGYHLIVSVWHPLPGRPSAWLGATPYAADMRMPVPSKGRVLALRDPRAVPALLTLLHRHALMTP
ncbi:polysialyltransferase family glycosyltransferase [Niveispirillum sp. KHB5.9]|uniref:polysialyltransferase family glycosyltransferase n=1 Tax=Niveispirillum sp. KHB5.9 TaxID=3400269 RepID=UPI003A891B2C